MFNFLKNNKIKIIALGLGSGLLFMIIALAIILAFFNLSRPYSSKNISMTAPSMQSLSMDDMAFTGDGSSFREFGIEEEMIIGIDDFDQGRMPDRKIIRRGDLSLRVNDINQSLEQINTIVKDGNGFVENSGIYENELLNSWRGHIDIRIPVDDFEETFNNLKQVAIKVESESISSEDVTDHYIDIEATLRNYRAEENQYLSIMTKADKIEDIIKVSEKLFNIRGQIERTEAQLLNLSRQIQMSTIHIQLTSDAEINIFGINWRPKYIFRKEFSGMLLGFNKSFEIFVSLLFKLPLVAIWLVIITLSLLILYRVIKLLIQKRRAQKKAKQTI